MPDWNVRTWTICRSAALEITSGSDSNKPTPKMMRQLSRMGDRDPYRYTFEQAKALIGRHMAKIERAKQWRRRKK